MPSRRPRTFSLLRCGAGARCCAHVLLSCGARSRHPAGCCATSGVCPFLCAVHIMKPPACSDAPRRRGSAGRLQTQHYNQPRDIARGTGGKGESARRHSSRIRARSRAPLSLRRQCTCYSGQNEALRRMTEPPGLPTAFSGQPDLIVQARRLRSSVGGHADVTSPAT